MLIPLFTFIGGLLFSIPIVGLPFTVLHDTLYWLLVQFVLRSSYLWDRVPPLRLPLALVGVPVSVLGYVFMSLTPALNPEVKLKKYALGSMCDGWPLSLTVIAFGQTNQTFMKDLVFPRWVNEWLERLREAGRQHTGDDK